MSHRFPVVMLLTSVAIVAAGCGSASVTPAAEASVRIAASPTLASPPPSAAPSLASPASALASQSPAASGSLAPTAFTNTVDNPWFPLTPGTTLTYQGTKDGKRAVETFKVTTATKAVAGVKCVVVDDRISLGGVPTEKLLGYYAQDQDGNVWSFGEDSQELDANGQVVSTDGSWRAGIDSAPPAFFMEASPTVGHTFAYDYTKNDFAVLSLTAAVTVPYGSFTNALVTKEWSPLEPDVETHKFYVKGVGVVRDVAVKGPTEEFVLVKVEH